MTGGEHYAEAERLLGEATRHEAFIPDSLNIGRITRERELADKKTARAQVHATLALAATQPVGASVGAAMADLYGSADDPQTPRMPDVRDALERVFAAGRAEGAANPGEGRSDG